MAVIYSGQITVATPGTAVPGPALPESKGGSFIIKALSTNTGSVYVGNDGAGDVTSANGFELAAGDQTIVTVEKLSDLRFDAAVAGEGVCWLVSFERG